MRVKGAAGSDRPAGNVQSRPDGVAAARRSGGATLKPPNEEATVLTLMSRIVPLALRAISANRIFVSAPAAEAHIEKRRREPSSHTPPARLRGDVTVTLATREGWPVYTVAPSTGVPRGSVVYLHGGAWVNEIVHQHWSLIARIAAESQTTVIVPIYPLVPFGTAAEVDAVVVALALEAAQEHGSVSLAGDSAGGQIALSASQTLRDGHGVTAALTVLISPAVDPSMKNPQMDAVQPRDPWLAKPGIAVFVDSWRGELSVDDPRVNALEADLGGLGPMLLFSGTRDILNPDARLLAERARAAGVPFEYHEGAGLVHVYPLTPTREGRDARDLIVARLRDAAV